MVAFDTKALINLVDVKSHPRFEPDVDRLTGTHSRCMLCAPLLTAEGGCLGVMQLINKVPSHDDDTVNLSTVRTITVPSLHHRCTITAPSL